MPPLAIRKDGTFGRVARRCAPTRIWAMALEVLSPDECFDLLAAARVGRLMYHDDLSPLAVPVNFALAGHNIVFRVEGGGSK